MEFIDYYQLLGIEQTASEDEVRKAIRATRKRFRQLEGSPDLDQRSMAEKKIAQIAQAEKTLTDEAARKEYDSSYTQNQEAAQHQQTDAESQRGNHGDLFEDARQYWLDGDTRSAAIAIKEATQAQHDNPLAWYLRGLIERDAKDYDDANYAVNQGLKLVPSEPRLHALRGEIADAEQRYADAEAAFRQAVYLDPERGYYAGRIAWALMDQGKTEDSLQAVRDASKKFPDDKYVKTAHLSLLLIDLSRKQSYLGGHFSQQDINLLHQLSEGVEHSDVSIRGHGVYYFANTKQIEAGKKTLAEIDSLGSLDDPDFEDDKKDVEGIRRTLEFAESRSFHWASKGWYILIVIAWLILYFTFRNASFIGILLILLGTAGLAYLGYLKTYPYGWQINQEKYGSDNKTGLQ